MSVPHKAILKIDVDIDGDGNTETGEFHMVGNLDVSEAMRTGFMLGGMGSTVNSVTSSTLAEGEAKRRGFYLDLGGGQHTIEVNFMGWEGATYEDENGNRVDAQWGNTGDPDELTVGDATGEDPLTQMQIFMNYLRKAEVDSRNPARVEIGQYSPDGILDDYLEVVIEGPRVNASSRDYSTYDGTMTLIEAEGLDNPVDAQSREDW